MNATQRAIKRAFDFISAFLGLIILSPLFLIIYIMLKRQKNGPAIFSQERIGYRGKPFTIYKFRTLSKAEDKPQLVAKCDDSNSTKTERFLREHHLDELPQLWNVLIGDMSLVGPRPERKYYIDQIMEIDNSYVLIYEMRPGLTSEATLYNGYTDSMEKMLKRLQMDIHYLENRSLALDFSIIMRTAVALLCNSTIVNDRRTDTEICNERKRRRHIAGTDCNKTDAERRNYRTDQARKRQI
jgi:lipopolysaccharide/colanic/teichoic acid biosynthesis glycosyltransferase